jgi:hypothetical protein
MAKYILTISKPSNQEHVFHGYDAYVFRIKKYDTSLENDTKACKLAEEFVKYVHPGAKDFRLQVLHTCSGCDIQDGIRVPLPEGRKHDRPESIPFQGVAFTPLDLTTDLLQRMASV